ncbi:MAG: citrate/2-methylcitrate synthase [Planctomycetota bacterium]|jgi:citrate synthase
MAKKRRAPVRGLEGVSAANTSLSFVDGQNGKLYYRGYDLDEIAGHVCYEEIVHLLWFGEFPTKSQLAEFRNLLVAEMRLPAQVLELLKMAPPSANPMVVLRTAVSALGLFDPDGGRNTEEANLRRARRILAQVATIVASLHRIKKREPIVSADGRMSFAENFLYMFRGEPPSELERDVFDTTLVLHADHGFCASTFSARVTVSTLAGLHSAIAAALANLKGPLHGGANRKVMEMLDEIGGPGRVKSYISGMLASGEKIMGFGHRVYKTEDPRSKHLKKFSERLRKRKNVADLMEISSRIEDIVMREKGIHPNVDFYSAIVQKALGIPRQCYTCIFAVARTAGWIAHVMEQFRDNRLIRPSSNYVGGFGRTLVPIEKRKGS